MGLAVLRGGWGSKLHLLTDGGGLPLAIFLSAGQLHESIYLEELVVAGYFDCWPMWRLEPVSRVVTSQERFAQSFLVCRERK
jgi:hypothetical protein